MLGYSLDEWQRDPELFMKLIYPEDLEQVVTTAERAVRGRGFSTAEYRMLDRFGETRWFRDEAVLVRDPAGQPVAWRGVAIDVTAKRAPVPPKTHGPALPGRPRRLPPGGRLRV